MLIISVSDININIKRLHPSQKQVIKESKRFNVVKCGRRWGKSTMAIGLAINPALNGYPVGWFCPTYRDLNESWIEIKYTLAEVTRHISEQMKEITLVTGGKIDFWSMEDPNSGRGRKYKRVIIDEAAKARNFKEAWEQTIRATLVDYKGDAWIFSTPKGARSYFSLLFDYPDKHEDWASWQKASIENPHISQSEIEEARKLLDPLVFAQEYLGEAIDFAEHAWAHAFDFNRHVRSNLERKQDEYIYLSFDFNASPCTCVAEQHYDNKIRILKEFSSHQGLTELCRIINNWLVGSIAFVTGDRSGWNKSELLESNNTAYDIIKDELELGRYQVVAPKTNPHLFKSRELVNGHFANHPDFLIDSSCENVIFDLKYVQADDDNKIVKDRNKDAGKADFIDCVRYLINTWHGLKD